MVNRNNIRKKFHQIYLIALTTLSLGMLIGAAGCSDGGGGGGSKLGYHLTGYNGVPVESNSSATASANSGLKFYAQAPWFVNITYQVYDEDGLGVSNLRVGDFEVAEDGVKIDPIKTELNLRKRDALPSGFSYKLKTVLLVDNSPSASVNFNKMLEACQVVIDYIDEKQQQEIAIVAYDDAGDPVLIQDFTSDVNELSKYFQVDGPNAIKRSFGISNFYGAVKYALNLWEDNPSPQDQAFVQGFLIALTDGNDTSGLLDVNDAIAARKNKQVITVAVGTDIPEATLANLERLGNAGYYPVPAPGIEPDEKEGKKPGDENLCEWMLVIQKKMLAFADAFYWLQYKSDTTSADTNKNHSITLSVINNRNQESDAVILGSFSSIDFLSGSKGIYFNSTAADPSGDTEIEIMIERGQASGSVKENVTATTYSRGGKNVSEFEWSAADSSIISIAPNSSDSSKGVITVKKPGNTTITVKDKANNVSNTLTVKVVVREFSYEIVQHKVESAPPWFVDATFQVRETGALDNQWSWITDMKREEFSVYENKGTTDENLVDLEKSEINLRKRNRLPSTDSYTLKTVLLIDNSPSVDEDNLDLIKAAAKAFVYRALVNNPKDNSDKGPLLDAKDDFQQEIAVMSFTEDGDITLVEDFTSDILKLNAVFDDNDSDGIRIPRGFSSISFYKGMVDALNLWDNDQSVRDGNNEIQQGVLVVLTDGWDSNDGFYDNEAVLGEIGDKQVICVGVADDLATQANINDLKAFGNDGYYSVANPGQTIEITLTADSGNPPATSKETITLLAQNLRHIQDEIVDYANSFYWLDYKSYLKPAGNCANTTDLDILINNNANKTGNKIAGDFETCEFFDGIDGMIYVNSTTTNPWGEDGPINFSYDSTGLFIKNRPYNLDAVTYNPDTAPYYDWKSNNNNIVNVVVDNTSYAHSRASLMLPQPPHKGTAQISIEDTENNSSKQLIVNVQEIVFPMPIAYYPFDGNAEDATGHGYDGQAFGATLTTDRYGDPNSAYSFNGVENDYIALDMFYGPGAGSVSSELNTVTVCAWIKSTNPANDPRIVSFGYPFWDLSLQFEKINWLASNPSDSLQSIATIQSYNDGNWHFVCGTYDNGEVHIFMDGQLAEVDGGEVAPYAADVRYGFIGVMSNATSYNGAKYDQTYFTGDIDDVIIFEQVLTPAQIQDLFNILK
jgi:hypothetical protein